MTESGDCPRCNARRVPPVPCPSCGWSGYTLDEWKRAVPEMADGLATVDRQLREGQKIQAIKTLRGLTGLGLKESKDAVESFAVGGVAELPVPATAGAPDFREDPEPTRAVPITSDLRDLLAAGRKIEAIKMVREATDMGLAEAKHYVDDLEQAPASTPVRASAPVMASPPSVPAPPRPFTRPPVVGAESERRLSPLVLLLAAGAVLAVLGWLMGWFR